uniref:Uncharacterized protein n=1 Tax=Vespula pensylvanica TaxID=30213 RepID=A0A834P1Z6_VESPE|nr:hypothetical protein H0235_007667 [Vespula pensylvanica]
MEMEMKGRGEGDGVIDDGGGGERGGGRLEKPTRALLASPPHLKSARATTIAFVNFLRSRKRDFVSIHLAGNYPQRHLIQRKEMRREEKGIEEGKEEEGEEEEGGGGGGGRGGGGGGGGGERRRREVTAMAKKRRTIAKADDGVRCRREGAVWYSVRVRGHNWPPTGDDDDAPPVSFPFHLGPFADRKDGSPA